jgi:hypothetical protein
MGILLIIVNDYKLFAAFMSAGGLLTEKWWGCPEKDR